MRAASVLDLPALDNEVLVVFAKECGYVPARRHLIERCRAETSSLIWLLGKDRLSPAECEDAAQNAAFAINQAINKYDTNRIARRDGGVSFRTFLYYRLNWRFAEFVRHLRRKKREQPASDALLAQTPSPTKDPAALAEEREQQERLEQAVKKLDKQDRDTWNLIQSGMDIVALAAHWGGKYDVARRRRNRLIKNVRRKLGL
jgi:RNA polymerase sigma factor (sigma-70 family)